MKKETMIAAALLCILNASVLPTPTIQNLEYAAPLQDGTKGNQSIYPSKVTKE